MRRFVAVSIIFMFFAWILPLGIFITPSKEKLFCGGQRAICLCSHSAGGALAKKNQSGETVMKVSPSANKEATGSFFSGQYDFAVNLFDKKNGKVSLYFSHHRNFYQLLVCKSIDHVPKA